MTTPPPAAGEPVAGGPPSEPAAATPPVALSPDVLSLDVRWQAFVAAKAAYDEALTPAYRLAASDPAASIAALDSLLQQTTSLEATQASLLVETAAAEAPSKAAACAAYWLGQRAAMLGFRWSVASWGSMRDEQVRTTVMEHADFSGNPDHPYWAEILEHDAELAATVPTAEELLDRAFPMRLQAGAFLEAARNRMRAVALAGLNARFDRQRACAAQAIDVADTHNLRREQVAFRVARFSMLLIGDQSGAAMDELREELDFTAGPRGRIADLLRSTYADGAAHLVAGADAGSAAATADSFALNYEAAVIRRAPDAAALAEALAAAASALDTQQRGQTLDVLLLCVQFKIKLNDFDTPVYDILPQALALADTPQAVCRVHSASAEAWEAKGKLLQAIAAASDAVEAVRIAGPPAVRAQAEAVLYTLKAQMGSLESALQQDPALDPDDYATRRLQAAVSALSAHAPLDAITTLDEALPIARTDRTRAALRLLRAFALYELERLPEAEIDLVFSAEVFSAAFESDPGRDGDLLAQRQDSYLLLAFVRARLGRPEESWTALEQGRSYLLRRRLGLQDCSWEPVRAALLRRNAALLDICVLRWGTLVATAAPGDALPTVRVDPGFKASDANQLLEAPMLGDDSDRWTQVLMGALPALSASLGPVLLAPVTTAVAHAKLLYVITDGPLAHAPLAGVELSAGKTLAELVPFAMLPFASLLQIQDDAAPHGEAPSTVALACGQDSTGFDFAQHLTMLAPVLSDFAAALYRDTAATREALQQACVGAKLLYLSSHGTLDHSIRDVDRASALALTDGRVVSDDLAHLPSAYSLGQGTLAFFNACQSGRFRALTRTEMGGFPAAFLCMGRRALIAPLTHVEPSAAVALAEDVLRALHGGATASGALQGARLRLKAAGAPPADWAAHQLYGLDTTVM